VPRHLDGAELDDDPVRDILYREERNVMGKTFNGKQASPFKKGGGRDQNHPNTAKGTPRKK
jgi:hypothetical protein